MGFNTFQSCRARAGLNPEPRTDQFRYKSDIELKEPFRIAIMETVSAQSVFIKINTNQDLYGLGEANPT